MKNLSLKNIAKICNGELVNCNSEHQDKEVTCVDTDSRRIIEGGLFIATPGENVDGHSFISQVSSKGALGVVCEKPPVDVDIPYILVKDSFIALKDIARFYRDQLNIPIIGVTGSVGKTSTKEFIAGTLSAKYKVCKTQGNYNNEIGMPLTILTIRDEHEIAVVEMGISDFGEMTRLTDISKPDVCVITNIGTCHLEKLIDRDGVLKAKTEIFKSMNPEGQVFVNGDDDKLITVKKPYSKEIIHYGFNIDANSIWADNIISYGLLGSDALIHIKDEELKVKVPLPGRHMIYNAMVAAGIAWEYGLSKEEIISGMESVKATPGRSNIIKTDRYILIDDCYNANPVSMHAAIDLLNLADSRKVAVLGDMFELGEDEKKLHYEVGVYAATNDVDCLITVGELSKSTFEGAQKVGMKEGVNLFHFASLAEAIEGVEDLLKEDDSILVKASHGMHFEKIVEELNKVHNN